MADGDNKGGAGETGGTGGTGGGAPAKPWYEGKVDAEVLGHWQNKGYDLADPGKIAIETTKAHREAEKFIGIPTNQIVRLPDPKNETSVREFWTRLGAPTDAKDYDLTPLKDEATSTAFRATAAALHLPKDVASRLASDLQKAADAKAGAEAAERTAKLQEQITNLDKNWGTNKAANLLVAKNAAAALGVDPKTVDALEGVVGYDKIMDMFLKIGAKIGEDKFVDGGNNNKPGIMTRDQAIAKMADLKKDSAWVKRYMEGGVPEGREMLALNTIIAGDDTEASRRA